MPKPPLPPGLKWRDVLTCQATNTDALSEVPRPCMSGDFYVTRKGELICRVCRTRYAGHLALVATQKE